MDDIDDPINITGIHNLINKSKADENFRLDEIEKSMLGTTGIKIIKERDPVREYADTIKKISGDTGISFGAGPGEGFGGEFSDKAPMQEEGAHGSWETSGGGDFDPFGGADRDVGGAGDFDGSAHGTGAARSWEYDAGPESKMGEASGFGRPNGFGNAAQQPRRAPQWSPPGAPQDPLDDVMRAYAGPYADINAEKEKEEDTKSILLEDIDELRFELESDGVDLSRIPSVDPDADTDTVKKIHKILRMKYDRRRCNTLGSEFLLAGAQGLEYIFDGERKIGPWQPDLTGFHNTVRSKLRRMRYETSSIVASVMHDYNIGPTMRILCELVPSMFVYSRMRKDQRGRQGYSADQLSEAYDDLNNRFD
jgi:hypothetical protein